MPWSEDEEYERIRVRYEEYTSALDPILPRLLEDRGLRTVLSSLESEGWKHWHLLAAVVSALLNRHARAAMLETPEAMEEFARSVMEEPSLLVALEAANQTDGRALTQELLHQALQLNLLAFLGNVGAGPRPGRGYNPDTMLELADRRYRYRQLDVEHVCPLGGCGEK